MRTKFVFSMIIAALMIFFPSAFGQSNTATAAEDRIIQSITLNGQTAQGVLVVENGTVQSYTCRSPAPYITSDQSESGWACFEQATGMWLLHAQPPTQAAAAASQQSPTVIYREPTTVYVPSYNYGYPYYPYSYYGYPYFWGPAFGLGFGFNFGHGFHNGRVFNNRFVFRNGHGFAHGGFNRGAVGFSRGATFGHGPGVVRGGFVHGGGGFRGGGGFHGGGGGFHGGHMGGGHR
jgi:hypothetical protein